MSLAAAVAAADAAVRLAEEQHDPDPLFEAADVIVAAAKHATPSELDGGLHELRHLIDLPHVQVAGLFALVGGSLVELGGSPRLLADAVLPRLDQVLGDAARFVELVAALPEPDDDDADPGPEDLLVGERSLDPDTVRRLADQDREALAAWSALESWEPAALACLLRAAEVRAGAVAAGLGERIGAIAMSTGGLRCLRAAVELLDEEPLLVIHPSTRQGWRFTVTGVADNFQLHMLLAGELLKPERRRILGRRTAASLPGAPPDPRALAVWRGEGPQEAPELTSSSAWDLYQWSAVGHDGRLLSPVPHQRWVWNEGLPADIERFEGVRTLLLGAPSYTRSFNTARFFDVPAPRLSLDAVLSEDELDDRLRRMAAASPH